MLTDSLIRYLCALCKVNRNFSTAFSFDGVDFRVYADGRGGAVFERTN